MWVAVFEDVGKVVLVMVWVEEDGKGRYNLLRCCCVVKYLYKLECRFYDVLSDMFLLFEIDKL